jgi:hypothetical protein
MALEKVITEDKIEIVGDSRQYKYEPAPKY